jgi:tetratricopeptide (TPR) repeat protein
VGSRRASSRWVAIATQRELALRDPTNTAWQFDLSRSYTRAGDGHLYLGAVDQAIAAYTLGLDIRRRLAAANPKNVPYRRSVAWSHTKLGNAHVHQKDVATAIAEHDKALDLRTALVNEAPKQTAFKNELAASEIAAGKLIATRDARRGAELVRSGLERARALVAADPINHEWRETLAQGLLARADVAKLAADPATRKTSLEEARTIAQQAASEAPHNAQWPVLLAQIHGGLAELGDAKTAAAEWKAVRDLLEPLAAAGRLYATTKPLLDRARAGR